MDGAYSKDTVVLSLMAICRYPPMVYDISVIWIESSRVNAKSLFTLVNVLIASEEEKTEFIGVFE